MITFNAHWTDATLNLWAAQNGSTASPGTFMEHDRLRRRAGDLWDSLLISGASESCLNLLLPAPGGNGAAMVRAEVPVLQFTPADTIDLLSHLPRTDSDAATMGSSMHYWAKLAELVMELLARQQFVPDLFRRSDGVHCGCWRVLLTRDDVAQRVDLLIQAMPPVCRAFASLREPIQPAALVENFLWATVDALVRRCMEDDELAHSILERSRNESTPQMQWLRSLVAADHEIKIDPATATVTYQQVKSWLAAVEPSAATGTCRTCLRLVAPSFEDADPAVPMSEKLWRLSFHVQACAKPDLVLDAQDIWSAGGAQPQILDRPFDGAADQLRADLALAARHFEPMQEVLKDEYPTECWLSLENAHRFLRDAVPVLEVEGFTLDLPPWWRGDRHRLGLRLSVQPASQPTENNSGIRLDSLVNFNWRVALNDAELTEAELHRLAAEKAPLVQVRGRWVELEPADVRAATEFMKKRDSGQMTLLEAIRWSYMADDQHTGLPIIDLRATGWIDDLLNARFVNEQFENVEPPDSFHGTLRPYQVRGLAWLSFLSRHGLGACLADDMGLGKTIQMIALWLLERADGNVPGPTLLIVPMSLVGNWQREIQRFAPSLRVMVHHGLERLAGEDFKKACATCDVVISTYGLANRDYEYLSDVKWHRLALDEAQNIKNPAAKQSQAVRNLHAIHRVALTGTPVENRLTELWSIMDFLNPAYLGSATDFRRRFAVPIERRQDTERGQKLRRLIRPFVLRRLKSDPDVLADLPDRIDMKVFCNLTREQAALYEAIVADMLGQIDRSGGIQRRGLILAALVKLKQICNHPVQYLKDGTGLERRSGKCERITEMLDEALAEGDKALVFTQFRQMGALLQQHLARTFNREVLFLHGGVPQKQRDALITRFQEGNGDTPIFVLSLKAGGVGLNLTAANHVFHYDRWWNPAVEEQATDRAHRIGQTRNVQVHKFVCLGTIEERIDEMIEHKKSLAAHIVGSGEDWITEMTTEKLRDLLTLSRDAIADE